MPNNEEGKLKSLSAILNNIQNGIDRIYGNTHYNDISWSKDLQYIKKDMDANLDNIISTNINTTGRSNISRLYSRISDTKTLKNAKNPLPEDLEALMGDKEISEVFFGYADDNKYIKELDEEIDIVLKYFPLLADALDAKKDNVLSADQYSKDFINVTNENDINIDATFAERVKEIKAKYDLIELFEDMYDDASKYGEYFLYCVDYNKAISRLLAAKNGTANIIASSLRESAIDNDYLIESTFDFDNACINENGRDFKLDANNLNDFEGSFNITLDMSGCIREMVDQKSRGLKFYKTIQEARKFDETIKDDLEFEGIGDSQEGLIDNTKTSEKEVKLKTTGFIIKKLARENVIPIYIDDMCLGYYYIESQFIDYNTKASLFNDPMRSLRRAHTTSGDMNAKQDKSLQYMATTLSTYIDSKFVNANLDLKNEIYMILKHSIDANAISNIKVTYLPPEDVEHFYFKMNKKTHRGISDLDRALVPAKLYVSLYVTTTLAIMTRGFDKRVYYVKQNIDTNISQVLLNTINQLKRANYGAREFDNIKNILNITGRYNDHIVPVGPTGDHPVDFEIMSGQNIDPKTDLMEMLEHNAVNSTDVPYEYVQSRNSVDFAIRLTMSNGKFLRKSFKRQAKCEPYFSRIVTKLYNGEYDDNAVLKVNLPAPAFLNIANTSQMIDNIDQYVTKICDLIITGDDSEGFTKEVKKKLTLHYLSTYIDAPMIDEVLKEAKIEAKVIENPNM